ncbi:MAG: PKD domain-containing protein [Prevotella sp.]|nr:PKD domain-containing protein [Prevotella sp.]
MRKYITFLLIAVSQVLYAQTLTADFTTDESYTVYYQQGWDSQQESATWSYNGVNSQFTWKLMENMTYAGQEPFSSINKDSKFSLFIPYAVSNGYQNENATSPEIEIKTNSRVEFYACFRSVYLVFGDWKLYITDTETSEKTLLLSGFMWSQDNEYTGPGWQRFSLPLNEYAGKKCKFTFNYMNGEDLYIDDFKVLQADDGATFISINEGEEVHFRDISTGNPAPNMWSWTFEGGNPSTSIGNNPTVSYEKAGDYSVKLTVKNGVTSATKTREGYVKVTKQAPQALIGIEEIGYLSPWVARFIPTDTPIAYQDLSTGKPTDWYWTFEGGDPATSTEQNPTVTYHEAGVYGMTLEASNEVGSSSDFMVKALQAGGSQYVWNITPEESQDVAVISLAQYGYYGGSNLLGLEKFAEKFEKPLQQVEIDAVQAFFYYTVTSHPQSPITVSICSVGEDGMPDEVLASASVNAGDLKYDPNEIVATDFALDRKVTIDKEFFVVIEGFQPDDKVCLMCMHRKAGEKSTAFHYLENEDSQGRRLGTYSWYENADDPMSMTITPRLTFTNGTDNAVVSIPAEHKQAAVHYNLTGQRIGKDAKGIHIVNGKKIKK